MENPAVVPEPEKKSTGLQDIFLVFLKFTVALAFGQTVAGPVVGTENLSVTRQQVFVNRGKLGWARPKIRGNEFTEGQEEGEYHSPTEAARIMWCLIH